MSGNVRRPKTAGPFQQNQSRGEIQDLPTGRLPRRPGSQMSQRAAAVGESCWPQYVPVRRVPSAMRRHIEIQTDTSHAQGATDGPEPISGGALFYPYYVPGIQDPAAAAAAGGTQQPFVLLSPWQLPGYQSLPVLDAAQLQLLDPAVAGRPGSSRPPEGDAPIYRSGRNGSCWRHIRQCTGNLGNNIMFIDGHVKEDDCRRFPPHGYAGASTSSGLSVFNRLAPKSQPRIAAGIPLGFPAVRQQQQGGGGGGGGGGVGGALQSQALERAKSGARYWYEDKKQATLVPNTIQGRIMKSGSAY